MATCFGLNDWLLRRTGHCEGYPLHSKVTNRTLPKYKITSHSTSNNISNFTPVSLTFGDDFCDKPFHPSRKSNKIIKRKADLVIHELAFQSGIDIETVDFGVFEVIVCIKT